MLQPGDLGQLVTRHIARRFDGDRPAAMAAAAREVARVLGVPGWRRWPGPERMAMQRLAPILVLIPDLARWTLAEKRDLVRVIRAKGGRSEAPYIRLLRGHQRLARSLLDLARPSAG
jgi:hypothetical protein